MNWTLVTGGAKRLGKEICLRLAESGHNLAIHYRFSEKEANNVAKLCKECGVEAKTIHGDFSTLFSLQDFLSRYKERFPSTKHLVNNVGNYFVASALKTRAEDWLDLYQTNVFAPLSLIQGLEDSLKKTRGSIVNIGTAGLTNFRAETYATAYMLSKQTLYTLTQSLAREFAPSGVRVNMVSPGILDNSVDGTDRLDLIPAGYLGKTEDVATVVSYLLNMKNHYITGQNIEVSGGFKL